MPNLLVKPHSKTGHVLTVSPDSVKDQCPNWSYVGFEVHKLSAGEVLARETGAREVMLVVISGRMNVQAGGADLGALGARMTLWDRAKGHALYVPSGSDWSITAQTELELAICSAPGKARHDIRVIRPDDAPLEARGQGANTRYVHAICMEERDWADSLLVTEVWTPQGNWSSYPSHKHDTDDFPNETYLEETYYHRLNPATGFAYQRVYNDDRSLDENMAASDGDVVLVPAGYHPCGAPYGYDLYYLNVMAGPRRNWRFTNDPDHDWIYQRDLKG
ncbi:MAG: 5-deoxy-glucuronate isomerase [Pseudomonadota bacterium]